MEFSIKKWRNFYDDVEYLSNQLRDSKSQRDDYGFLIRAKNYLSEETKKHIQSDIEKLLEQTSTYLDRCGIAVQEKPLKKL